MVSHWYAYHSKNTMKHSYDSITESAIYLSKKHKKLGIGHYIWVIEGDNQKPVNFTLVDCFKYSDTDYPPFKSSFSIFKKKIMGNESLLNEKIKLDDSLDWFAILRNEFITKQKFFVNLSDYPEIIEGLSNVSTGASGIEPKVEIKPFDDAPPDEEYFGEIEGYPEGSSFKSREELRLAGLHRHKEAGIAGKPAIGADAIVVNEGYEDDEDLGDEIIYTGAGGRDSSTGNQTADQKLERGNAALVTSQLKGYPVRVIRGYKLKSNYAPDTGYQYSGLYIVESHWWEIGKSGYKIIRFKLIKIDNVFESKSQLIQPKGNDTPNKVTMTVTRTVRDTKVSKAVKGMYKDNCQVCGETIFCEGGTYSEGAHIKPLGHPHNGPDTMSNILCLCPNHHVQFDKGGLGISDDFSLIGYGGGLNIHPAHELNMEYVQYRRGMFPSLEMDNKDIISMIPITENK